MDRIHQLVSKGLQKQVAGAHPDADTLSAFAESALSRAEQQQVLTHVADCKDCRDILYLAQPDSGEMQSVAAFRPNRVSRFAFRWGAVAASLVIVAGGLFLTREEFLKSGHKAAQSPVIQQYDKLAVKQLPPTPGYVSEEEPATLSTPAMKMKDEASNDLTKTSKVRPEEKHMTAKLQSPLKFDSSDQVQMAPAANSTMAVHGVAQNNPSAGRNEIAASRSEADQPAPAPQAFAKAKDTGAASTISAAGPSTSSNFGGTVLDQTGASVPNARVTISGPNGANTANSDHEGKFSFDGLPSGSYSLKAVAPGFKPTEVTQIAVLENKTLDLPVKLEAGSAAETVEVSGAALQADSAHDQKVAGALIASNAMSSQETTTEVATRDRTQPATLSRKNPAAPTSAGSAGKITPQAQWTLSSDGIVQRSFDAGKSWQPVSVGNASGYQGIFSAGSDVWVGGKAGSLYHSGDFGQTWKQVTAGAGTEKLTADITHIEFSDGANGSISAANGEVWLTSDGGQTWHRK